MNMNDAEIRNQVIRMVPSTSVKIKITNFDFGNGNKVPTRLIVIYADKAEFSDFTKKVKRTICCSEGVQAPISGNSLSDYILENPKNDPNQKIEARDQIRNELFKNRKCIHIYIANTNIQCELKESPKFCVIV